MWDETRDAGTTRGGASAGGSYNARMNSGEPSLYQRYLPRRRSFEVGFWVFSYLASAIGNSITANMDVQRLQLGFTTWQPAVWEARST